MQSKLKTEMLLIFVFMFLTTLTYTASQNQDEDCTCVMYYLCSKVNRTVITDGNGLIDERMGQPCTCNPSCPENEVCCQLETNSTTRSLPAKSKCGVSNPDGVAFKIGSGGENAQFGEFPWMVGILDDSGGYRCGGSLIHPSVVLTAAHCVVRKKTYIVRAGEWDSSNTQEILKHKDLPVASIKIHEDYYPPVHHNDVALLFINGSFSLSEAHINTVCLPPVNAALDNERCYVTGWGKDRFGVGGKYPAVLKKVDLPLVERNTCQANLRQTKLGQHFNLHRSSLCAGGEKDKDACIGDGGGPLVCPMPGEESRYYQVGIVSWGVECNKENVPGVYGNVQIFREWIDQQMVSKNIAKSYFQN